MNLCEAVLTSKRAHSVLKHSVVCCLSTASGSHYHETMTHLNGIVELNNLHNEGVYVLKVEMLARIV